MVFGGAWMTERLFTSNEALDDAMQIVNSDPRAIEALGQPIEHKLWRDNTTFNFSGKGKLRANFSVIGPEGEGRLELEAQVKPGTERWVIDRLVLDVDGSGATIDLLGESDTIPDDATEDEAETEADAA